MENQMTVLIENLKIAQLRMKAARTHAEMVSAMNSIARLEKAIREYNLSR